MRRLCGEAGIPVIEVGVDVDVVVRASDDRRIVFVINHRDEPIEIASPALVGLDLVSGTAVAGPATIVPAGASSPC